MHRPIVLLAIVVMAGCASLRNPSFDLDIAEAQAALRQMHRTPRPLERPLIVIGGWLDPGIACTRLATRLRQLTGDDRILALSVGGCGTFDGCRDKVQRVVAERFGAETDVDVVAYSMGGLVARYAAVDQGSEHPPLRIVRLFTISSPHRGTDAAAVPTWDRLLIDMRPGSPFLAALDQSLEVADYELYTYIRLGDDWIGPANAAPADRNVWWVANRPLEEPHMSAYRDPRILADIARRLRGEPAYATIPASPLPESHSEIRRGG